jgi:acyl-CoA synthetase (NDP forming)
MTGAGPLDALLRPRSIGVVGISRPGPGKSSVGGMQVLNELAVGGFAGPIYPVHPAAESFGALPAYASLAKLPETPDVLVVARPAAAVIGLAAEAGAMGVKALVVLSAGFGELGTAEGLGYDVELRQLAAEHSMVICGPNSLGVMNAHSGAYMCNFPPLELAAAKPGGLAIVSHSGAIAGSLIGLANDRGIGLSYVLSSGNELTLTAADCLRELGRDDTVTAVSLYLEGATDGRDLMDAVAAVTAVGKTVVALKVGDSASGARAAMSHTAKISGEQALYRGALRQAGATIATSLEELISLPMYREAGYDATVAPRRACVLSLSGGLGGVVADEFSRCGIEVPELTAETRAALDALELPLGGISNPVDTAGATQRNPDALLDIAQIVGTDPGIDVIALALPSRFQSTAHETPRRLGEISKAVSKPLVVIWIAGRENLVDIAETRAVGVACFDSPTACARALASAGEFARHLGDLEVDRAAVPRPAVPAPSVRRRGWLNEPETKALLREYGVPGVREALATSAGHAVSIADGIGYPVALKVVSADVVHKAAVGGVRLGVASSAHVGAVFEDMIAAVAAAVPDARIDGVLISEMIDVRSEFLIGTYQDQTFGPTLAFGRGGSQVEEHRKVALRLLPLTGSDCVDIVASLLAELDDRPGQDATQLLVDAVRAVADFADAAGPALMELDVNPIIVSGDNRVVALDAVAHFTEVE